MKFHHPAVPIVLCAILIDSIGFGIVMPVLPRLIVELSGVSLADAARIGGYMLVAFAGAQFFAGPVLGTLGDAVGRRPVLLFSMIAFSIDYGLMAAAPSIGWLFAGRIVAGIAGACYGPANAVLADITPPERRGAVFGWKGAAFGVGFVLGPAIGGLLASFGPRAPFLAAAALAAINAAWIFFALPETLARADRRRFAWKNAHIFAAFKPLFHAGNAKWLLLAAFCWQVACMVYPATWAFFGEIALGWSEAAIGLSLAGAGMLMASVQLLVTGPAIARVGEARTAVIGILGGTLAYAGYVFARDAWLVCALFVPGAFQALVWPAINALLSQMTDASRQGALQGGLGSLNSIASVLAPLLLTQSLAYGSERGFTGGNFLVAALLGLAALLIVLVKVVPRVASAEPVA